MAFDPTAVTPLSAPPVANDFVPDRPLFENPLSAAEPAYEATTTGSWSGAVGQLAALNPLSRIGRAADIAQAQEAADPTQALRTARRMAGIPESADTGDTYAHVAAPSPTLTADEANVRYAPKGTKLFTADTPDSVARVMGEQKTDEIARDGYLSRWAAQASLPARVTAGLAAGLLDPLNDAAAFVPGIGEEAVLANLGRLGFSTSTTVARLAARGISGATAGAAGMAPIIGLNYGLAKIEGSDYTFRDAMSDLAFGAAIGAAGHAGIGALREAGVLRPDFLLKADAATKMDATRAAAAQMMSGREIDVRPVFDANAGETPSSPPPPPPPPHPSTMAATFDIKQFNKELEQNAANQNLEPASAERQAQIKASLPESPSRDERDWQNYGKRMTPDDVLASDLTWNAAANAEALGVSRAEAFANKANDLWQRMGANRFMTPDMARQFMAVEETKARASWENLLSSPESAEAANENAAAVGAVESPGLSDALTGYNAGEPAGRFGGPQFDYAPQDLGGFHVSGYPTAKEEPSGFAVWHGSPYDFDKFSLGNINSGEGAQAFGHGLYFADSEKIARYYLDSNKKATVAIEFEGKKFSGGPSSSYDPNSDLFNYLVRNHGLSFEPAYYISVFLHAGDSISDIKEGLTEGVQNDLYEVALLKGNDAYPEALSKIKEAEERIKDNKKALAFLEKKGSEFKISQNKKTLYGVRIKADPEHFLDWDKPANEQTPHVQEALRRISPDLEDPGEAAAAAVVKALKRDQQWPDGRSSGPSDSIVEDYVQKMYPSSSVGARRRIAQDVRFRWLDRDKPGGGVVPPTGKEMYSTVGGLKGSPSAASKALLEAGIPGIKYLDGTSRAAGEGTRNYVVFDDGLLEITHKNGVEVEKPIPLVDHLVGELQAELKPAMTAAGVAEDNFSAGLQRRAARYMTNGTPASSAVERGAISSAPAEDVNAVYGGTASGNGRAAPGAGAARAGQGGELSDAGQGLRPSGEAGGARGSATPGAGGGGQPPVESPAPIIQQASEFQGTTLERLQNVVNELKNRFGIDQDIEVSIAPASQYSLGLGWWLKNSDTKELVSGRIRVKEGLSPESQLAVVTHEFGHMLQRSKFDSLPPDQKTSILAAFSRDVIGILGKPGEAKTNRTKISEAVGPAVTSAMDDAMGGSYEPSDSGLLRHVDFNEWFANQVSKFLTTNQEATTIIDKFFKGIADMWRQLYETFTGRKGAVPEMEDFLRRQGKFFEPDKPPFDPAKVAREQRSVYQDGYAPGIPQNEFDATRDAIFGDGKTTRPDEAEKPVVVAKAEQTQADKTLAEWQTRFDAEGLTLTPEEKALVDATAVNLDRANATAEGYAQAGQCLTGAGI